MRRTLFLALLAAALTACATAAAGGGASSGRGSRTLLTSAEIRESPGLSTAYEAVRRLRPSFLQSRGVVSARSGTPEPVMVYLNGVRLGGPEALQQIPAMDVVSIRHVNARDATTKYGTGHAGGVLEVRTGN